MTVLYGPLGHSGQITAAAKTHLQAWLPAYLAEMERQTGRDPQDLPIARAWRTAAEIDQWLSDVPPAVLIACPGTLDTRMAERRAARNFRGYHADWDLRVAVIVEVGGTGDPDELAGIYGAAIRAALMQHPTLTDDIRVSAWTGEILDDVPSRQSQTLGMAINHFTVQTRGLLPTTGGPSEPPDDPYAVPPDPTYDLDTADIAVTLDLDEETP